MVSYIEKACKDNELAPVFKLADLVILYSNRLKQLETELEGCINSARLKEKIMDYFQDMEAHKQGQDMVLNSNADVGSALNKACEHDTDNDAIHPTKAVNTVRSNMFKLKNQFNS